MSKKEILKLNCKIKENRESMQCMLKQLKVFKKISNDIKVSHLEKAIFILCNKHNVNIDIYLDYYDGDTLIYHCTVTSKLCNFSVYATSIYELYAKILLYFLGD